MIDAIRGHVVEFFFDAVIQRCLGHERRNIKGKLAKRCWGELSRLFARLCCVLETVAVKEVFGELKAFLESISVKAYRSLRAAGGDQLSMHYLNVHNSFHRSLLRANANENSFLIVRRKLSGLARFCVEAYRWASQALSEAEIGFSCDLLPQIIAAADGGLDETRTNDSLIVLAAADFAVG